MSARVPQAVTILQWLNRKLTPESQHFRGTTYGFPHLWVVLVCFVIVGCRSSLICSFWTHTRSARLPRFPTRHPVLNKGISLNASSNWSLHVFLLSFAPRAKSLISIPFACAMYHCIASIVFPSRVAISIMPLHLTTFVTPRPPLVSSDIVKGIIPKRSPCRSAGSTEKLSKARWIGRNSVSTNKESMIESRGVS